MTFNILIDGANLGNSITAMKANCKECLATFPTPDVMFLRAMDTAGVALCECKAKVVVTGEHRELGLDLEEINTDLAGPVDIEVSDKLYIQEGRVRHKIKMIDPQYIKRVGDPKIIWPFVFDLPASELKLGFNEVCKKIPTKEVQEGVLITWTTQELIIEDMNRDKVDVRYSPEELQVQIPCDRKVETLVPVDYIRPLVTTLGKLDRCTVRLGQEMPIHIAGSAKDLAMNVGFLIANRIISK